MSAVDEKITQEKTNLLKLYYPEIDPEFLRELLESCNGSVEQVKKLIVGDVYGGGGEKMRRGHKRSLYQSSLVSVFSMKKNKRVAQQKVVHLHTSEDVEAYLGPYVSFHKDFLPQELSDRLLRTLMQRKTALKCKEFYLFDNLCRSSHTSGIFVSTDPTVDIGMFDGLNYNGEQFGRLQYFHEELQCAADAVKKFMNETLVSNSKRLPFQAKGPWLPNTCVVNYFETLNSHLDMHSDRLANMGPHNYIGSLSLGSTREFRLRKNYGDSTHIFSIDLPHNTLLVMHPGCQEEYKHGVRPQLKAKQINPISGVQRFNMTFRYFPPEFVATVPKCKCNIPLLLRRSYKTVEARGKYFWSCENKYQKKDCGTFHWADFNNREGNFIADSEDDASVWIADDDYEKQRWLEENSSAEPLSPIATITGS